jgi:outer membrane protein assembly factor BamB
MALVRAVDGNINALARADGQLRWQRRFDGPISDLVAFGSEQCVFASTVDGVYALNTADGSTRWHADLAAAEDPPLVVDARVYALGRYGDLVALNADDGALLWRAHLDIGDTHALLWWRDRIVVVLDGGVIGVIDPADGHVAQRIAMKEPPDLLAVDATRLVIALQSGRMLAIDRAMLRVDATDLELDDRGRLQQREPKAAPSIEMLQPGLVPPQQLWRTRVVGQVRDIGVGDDATLYFGDEHATMALAANGEVRWRASIGYAQASGLALGAQELYLGRRDHAVYALNRQDGSQRWRFETGAAVMAAPVLDGERVFIGSDDQNFYALNALDGSVLWSFHTQRPVRSTAVVGNGMVLFGGADRHVYARDARTGAARWQFEAADWIVAQPVIAGQRVFVGVGNGDVHALDLRSGRELWHFHAGGKVWFRPAVDAQRVYFGSGDGHVYALDQETGIEQWRFRTGASAEGSVELADGVLYAGSHDFHLYALDQGNGRALWRMRTGGSVFNPRVVDGRLYVASADQYLYALRLSAHP